MRVLLLNSVVSRSTSTGYLTCDIADAVNRISDGVCTVAYSQPSGAPEPNTFRFGYWLENKIHALFSSLLGLQGYFSQLGTLQLIRYIKKNKIQLVHIHNMHSNDLCFPLLFHYLAKHKIKVVFNLHDCWLYTGRCFHYTRKQCFAWQKGCICCGGKCRSTRYLFGDNVKKLYADRKRWYSTLADLHVVGVSKWIAEEAKKSALLQGVNISYIYNWVDTSVFVPLEDRTLSRAKDLKSVFLILGVCGTWTEEKGFTDILNLAKHLPENVRILLVGNVADRTQIDHIEKIKVIPPVYEKQKLAQLYASADLFLNLSLEESFGMTNAEALSCGTPILVYDSTASTEFIAGGCGYAAAPGDVADLLNGVAVIRKQDPKALAQRCREFAQENFSARNTLQYIRLYQSMLEEK